MKDCIYVEDFSFFDVVSRKYIFCQNEYVVLVEKMPKLFCAIFGDDNIHFSWDKFTADQWFSVVNGKFGIVLVSSCGEVF